MTKKILVTEKIAEEGIEALEKRGYQVDVKLDLTPEQLIEVIPPYEALIVRSQTFVTPSLIEAAENLKVIGRAGVTVDNIDIEAATEAGIIVCNAPTSNIVSAAEHTMALMLAAARKIPQANASMHAGEWVRTEFVGTELYGKTLAIFGLGRIGGLVAERARAFGMRLIAHDPYCSPERAEQLGVTLYDSVDEAVTQADFITVHLPKTVDTIGMFGPEEFAAMKDGVILVNAARGGIYQPDSLADFVAAGKIAAVGIDVYEEEPCTEGPLHEFDNALLTPHIAAVTREAQVRAGIQIANYVWAGLEGSIVPTAINVSPLPPEVLDALGPYVPACKMMGRVIAQVLGNIPKSLRVELAGTIADADPEMLVAGVLDGILTYRRLSTVTSSNVDSVAARHGISVQTTGVADAQEYASSVRVIADGVEISSTLFGIDQAARIASIMGYKIDMAPAKHSLIFEYVDAPGRIGTIGTILGAAGVNITTMQIGTKPAEQCALVYMNVEGEVNAEVLDELRAAIDLKNLWALTL
ncbi:MULTISPECIES: phosphoglycerate dehydrogenase [unclassified Adlercreutzia]|uniref:phosphoglycerate dehydrogenase n=1 Tax=unclassified Adlercreutzia TaxID=2636013 RepID=UPI0013EC82EC|nr:MULTISPECIES: phosphoglycerate dehydrogenase [unclassified Adlercreutzia]